MLKLDTLNQLKQLKQEIIANRHLVEGTVKGSGNKFGFVNLDNGKDIYLPAEEMEKVLPGDRIEIEIVKDAKNKKVAKIERLISSPTREFCGKYITKGKTHFIEPDIAGMNRWFFVPPQKRKNAQNKDLVKCRVSQHPYQTGNAQAAVVEVIGQEQDIGIEFKYAARKHAIRQQWNPEIEKQLAQLSESTIMELAKARNDLTDRYFITIDSQATVDIDDALYAKETADGWQLSIAIADPSALIPEQSAIEKEALLRASSLYFPGQHISMLPEKIAGDLCSLKEDCLRLAKVITIQVSHEGKIADYALEEALIRSRKKLSYHEISNHFDTANADFPDELKTLLAHLKNVTQALLEARKADGIVQAERKEFYLELNEQQKIAAIKQKVPTLAHKIVEESMVAANRCIADFLARENQPSIFVSHKGLRNERVESVNKVLTESFPGYQADAIRQLEGFVQTVHALNASEEFAPLALLISRQLDKSSLSSLAEPHFGLGLPCYTTFTSPLRKAQDYLVHRQLGYLLKNQRYSIKQSFLTQLMEATQAIRNAVADAEQWLKCQYLAKNTDILDASILRIFSTGFQVRLIENGIEGFISTKDMEDKFSFNQDRLQASRKGQIFQLDQIVQVRLKQIDWTRKQIQFDLVDKATENAETA
jgi:ribonuclease R